MADLKDVFPKEELEKITKINFNTGEELSGEELYFERITEMKTYVIVDRVIERVKAQPAAEVKTGMIALIDVIEHTESGLLEED